MSTDYIRPKKTRPLTKNQPPLISRWDALSYRYKYEAECRTLYAKSTYLNICEHLGNFFMHFKGYVGLEEFTIAEVMDYIMWRISNGAGERRLVEELRIVRRFWIWILENQRLPLTNPVQKKIAPRLRGLYVQVEKAKMKGITLNELRRDPEEQLVAGDYIELIGGVF